MQEMREGMRGRPKMVRQLISSGNATPTVLGLLTATQAGKRAQRQKHEGEKQEKERETIWGLDEDRLEGDEEKELEGKREDRERGGEG